MKTVYTGLHSLSPHDNLMYQRERKGERGKEARKRNGGQGEEGR